MTAIAERFRVSCLIEAASVADQWAATHVISLLDPDLADHHVPVIKNAEHSVFRLRDQENQASTQNFPEIVGSLFETMRPVIENPASRILVHCHAGVSRSTAFAYAMIAHNAGQGQEQQAFDAFLALVNKPWPNRRIIEILDEAWLRNGALLKPLDAMRARNPRRIEAWERFNQKRGFFHLYSRYAR